MAVNRHLIDEVDFSDLPVLYRLRNYTDCLEKLLQCYPNVMNPIMTSPSVKTIIPQVCNGHEMIDSKRST